MAEERKTTNYRVLQHLGSAPASKDWRAVLDVEAYNAPQAIRQAVEMLRERGDPIAVAAVFVAVPVSSWTERGVKLEVQTSINLIEPDAKPVNPETDGDGA